MLISGTNIRGGNYYGAISSTPAVVTDPYFNYVSLLLPGNGTNNAQNNTFVDGSTNNFTITRAGNTTQGTLSPYSPAGWSVYFPSTASTSTTFGTGQYLITGQSSAFALGSGNWTIECWYCPTAKTKNYPRIFQVGNGTNVWATGDFWALMDRHDDAPTKFSWACVNLGVNNLLLTSTTVVQNGTWYHLAVVRSGNTFTMYVNGVAEATYSNSGAVSISSTCAGYIGSSGAGDSDGNGYISNLRLVKGTAVYTGNFTPPTAPLTAIAGTSLLTCQSNGFKDNSTNNFTLTVAGSPAVTSSTFFNPSNAYSTTANGGSAYFDGTGDYLNLTGSALGSGAFKIEMWVYMTSYPNSQNALYSNGTADSVATAVIYINSSGNLAIYNYPNSITTSSTVPLNQWNHIAVVRNNGTFSLYINGISGGSGANTNNISDNAVQIMRGFGGITNSPIGYVSNLRVVVGTAVYTGNFTPPTQPVTAIANTSLLLNFTNAAITDAATRNVLETVGDAKISTAQSKWGGGSMYFDGSGDWLSGSKTWVPTGLEDFTIECWYYPVSKPTNYPAIFASNTTYNGTTGISIYDRHDSYPTKFSVFGCGVTLTSTTLVSNSNWYYVAVSRQYSGGVYTLRLFVNGVLESSATGASGSLAPDSLFIGRADSPSLSLTYLNGYINDFRITKGIARYTANFTPPAQAFPVQ